MKEIHQVKEQLSHTYKELNRLTKADYGTGAWRRLRGYIDALEWVIDDEGNL